MAQITNRNDGGAAGRAGSSDGQPRTDAAGDIVRMRQLHGICTEFESAWLTGKNPQIESFLESVPGLPRQELLESLIQSEIELRLERGDCPTRDEFRRRFPDDSAAIDGAFRVEPATGFSASETAEQLDQHGAATLGEPGPQAEPQAAPHDTPRLHASSSPMVSSTNRIGKFGILGEIARGGMGVVYRARHAALGRTVALKVILAGHFASDYEIERFRREATALAQLDHPGIVPVLEVGEWAGHHFIAMPLVEGVNLAERMANSAFSPRHAATLIRDVAQSIHYAHERGIIHRDLKPRNIMLDGNRPRVTDFGLAKFIASTESRQGMTETGQVLGTPSYMAPEQSSGRAADVAQPADIYSLGAVLYELLTGRPPFRGESPLETLEQARTLEPAPPRRLNAGVPHDLETICLKCLAKHPAGRYGNADKLAADLSRFLDGRPILARPTPIWERAMKWSRRRPAVAASMGVTAVAIVALIAGWIAYTAQLQIARDDAEHARDKAKDAAELAEAHAHVANVNADLAESRREDAARQLVRAERNSVWAMEAVDKLLTKIGDQRLAGVPEMDEVRRELLEEALKYCQVFLKDRGDPDPVARRAVGLAYQSTGRLHRVMGQPADAANDFAEAIAAQRKLADEFPDIHAYRHELARSLYNLYLVQTADTSLPRELSTQTLLQTVEIRERLVVEHPEVADYRWSLAKNLIALGPRYRSTQPEKTESIYGHARELLEKLIAGEPKKVEYLDDLKILLGNVSVLQWNRGQQATAIETSREACELAERVFDVDPSNPRYQFRLASAYEQLATHSWLAGRPNDAIEPYDQALAVLEKLAREHPSIDEYAVGLARSQMNAGLFHRREGRHAQSLAALEKSVSIMKNLVAARPTVKSHPPELAEKHIHLGAIQIDQGQYETARELTAQAVAILEPAVAADEPHWAMILCLAYSQLGLLHHGQVDLDSALEWHIKGVQLADAVVARHPVHADARRAGAVAYRGFAATLDARNQLQDALAAWDKSLALSQGESQNAVSVGRATTLARLGEHAIAVAAVKPIEELNFRHEIPPHQVAYVYACAAESARRDEKLPAADRERLMEDYAKHAVELLAKLFARGDFNLPASRLALTRDPALDTIRDREDFQDLIRMVERTSDQKE